LAIAVSRAVRKLAAEFIQINTGFGNRHEGIGQKVIELSFAGKMEND